MANDAEPEDYNGDVGSVFPAMAADDEGWSAGRQAKAQLYGLLVRTYECRAGCASRRVLGQGDKRGWVEGVRNTSKGTCAL